MDQYSIMLPVDPWTRLIGRFGLENITPYDETWSASKDVALYIKDAIKPRPGKPKTYRVLYEESGISFAIVIFLNGLVNCASIDDEPILPMSPALLTRQAVKATPKIGTGRSFLGVPFNNATLLSEGLLSRVGLPEVPEPQVNRDNVL
jgi:hypothetical protein